MRGYITTSLNNKFTDIDVAKNLAAEYELVYISRGDHKLETIFDEYKLEKIFIMKNGQLAIVNRNMEEFFFHPGTASIRTKVMRKGNDDLLIQALAVPKDARILDCNLGLANDSIVMAFYLDDGEVIGLEKSFEIFLITKFGLKNYRGSSKILRKKIQKIKAYHADSIAFLENCDDYFDAIYFDPMFEKPLMESSGINKFREYASYDQLSPEIIDLALKRSKRVVVKVSKKDYDFFKKFNPKEIFGKNKSSTKYAVFY